MTEAVVRNLQDISLQLIAVTCGKLCRAEGAVGSNEDSLSAKLQHKHKAGIVECVGAVYGIIYCAEEEESCITEAEALTRVGHIYRNTHILHALFKYFLNLVGQNAFRLHPVVDKLAEFGLLGIMLHIIGVGEIEEEFFDNNLIAVFIHKGEETVEMVAMRMSHNPTCNDWLFKEGICL